MLSNMTIGQFFPGESVMHRLDPRVKLCGLLAQIVLLFTADNFGALGLMAGLIVLTMGLSKIRGKLYAKSLKPVWFIVAFTSVLNLFYGTGDPLIKLGGIQVTKNGIYNGIYIAARIIFMMLASSVLTFTTSPTQLTDAIERLLRPLGALKVPVHDFAMMMTIALRFIPILIEEADKIMSAQKARGSDMESGGILQRIRALIPILVPLFISAFRRAFDLATAMESRCYRGGQGRTKLRQSKISPLDFVAMASFLLTFSAFLTLQHVLPPSVRL